MKDYPDLQALLLNDVEAKNYFNNLPAYVQDQISSRSGGVNSLESLMDYADNLTRGDN